MLSKPDIAKLIKDTINEKLNDGTIRLKLDGDANAAVFKVRIALKKQVVNSRDPNNYGYTFAVTTVLAQQVQVLATQVKTSAETWRMDGFDLGRPRDVKPKVANLIKQEISQFALEFLLNR
jgi:hypothetical protein